MIHELRTWLAGGQFEPIVELAGRKKRVLSWLTALTYDPAPLICWRAIEATGLAAGRIADDEPEFVRNYLLRLFWLLTDESGGIGWRAPEAIGEIIRARPDRFAQFWPLVASLLDMEPEDAVRFRPGMLWAIGRLGQVRPEAVWTAIPWILPCLDDPYPPTRGLAAWSLGQLGAGQHLAAYPALLADAGPVEIYQDGHLAQTSVARLARQALERGT